MAVRHVKLRLIHVRLRLGKTVLVVVDDVAEMKEEGRLVRGIRPVQIHGHDLCTSSRSHVPPKPLSPADWKTSWPLWVISCTYCAPTTSARSMTEGKRLGGG